MAAAKSVNLLREFSVPLLVGVAAALVWANFDYESHNRFVNEPLWRWNSLRFYVNEIFMALFFGMAAVEITDSLLPGGGLHPPTRALSPLLATLGGVLGPVGVYFLLNAIWGDRSLSKGWGITTATDIALAWLVARIIFGADHPAVSFLLLLAIADDAIGLAIIAIFYPDPEHAVRLLPLGLVALGMLIAWVLRRRAVRSYWPFLLVGGTASWIGLYLAHLHPALALVFIVPFMPHAPPATGEVEFDLADEDRSVLSRFEREWKVVVDFGLFFFGLANAGVRFAAVSEVTWLVLASLAIGKTFGITIAGALGVAVGLPLPRLVAARELLLTSFIAGMGLTVALFVAGVAFTEPPLQGAAKMGALLSGLLGPIAIVAARLWPDRRRH